MRITYITKLRFLTVQDAEEILDQNYVEGYDTVVSIRKPGYDLRIYLKAAELSDS